MTAASKRRAAPKRAPTPRELREQALDFCAAVRRFDDSLGVELSTQRPEDVLLLASGRRAPRAERWLDLFGGAGWRLSLHEARRAIARERGTD